LYEGHFMPPTVGPNNSGPSNPPPNPDAAAQQEAARETQRSLDARDQQRQLGLQEILQRLHLENARANAMAQRRWEAEQEQQQVTAELATHAESMADKKQLFSENRQKAMQLQNGISQGIAQAQRPIGALAFAAIGIPIIWGAAGYRVYIRQKYMYERKQDRAEKTRIVKKRQDMWASRNAQPQRQPGGQRRDQNRRRSPGLTR
jgi:hypothetical protein